MKKLIFLAASHAVALAVGFALGIYALPILIAPPAPSAQQLAAQGGPAMNLLRPSMQPARGAA